MNASGPGYIRDSLPAPVRRYFDYALPGTGEVIVRMEALQQGTLRTAVDSQRWLAFTASHRVEPAVTAFAWDARVRMLGPLSLRVSDGFRDGQGYGKVGLGKRITLARAQSDVDMNTAALQRYLAEAVWYPSALLPQAGVSWSARDDRSAMATLRRGSTEASLEFHFRDDGSVARVYSTARARKVGTVFIATPWEGQLDDYREYQGFRLPRRARVGWWLNDELALVWRGEIELLELELGPGKNDR